jgi:shikimate kinase
MQLSSPVFLTGFMGAGKTSVGRELARALHCPFVDLDEVLEKSWGMTVPEIFASVGEAAFRLSESKTLLDISADNLQVVACGGGCPVYKDNMQIIRSKGISIYLRCHPGVLFHRLAPQKNKRPLIADIPDLELMEFISELLHQRHSVYKMSQFTVDGHASPQEVSAAILEKLKN